MTLISVLSILVLRLVFAAENDCPIHGISENDNGHGSPDWICESQDSPRNDSLYPYRTALVTYADPPNSIFTTTQKLLNDSARSIGGIDVVISWDSATLHASEYWQYFSGVAELYPEFLSHKCSFWLWKPWIIRDALLRMDDGDFVVRPYSFRIIHNMPIIIIIIAAAAATFIMLPNQPQPLAAAVAASAATNTAPVAPAAAGAGATGAAFAAEPRCIAAATPAIPNAAAAANASADRRAAKVAARRGDDPAARRGHYPRGRCTPTPPSTTRRASAGVYVR